MSKSTLGYVALGILLGLVLAPQLRRIPGVSSIPTL